MFVGHSRPQNVTWTVSGVGATLLPSSIVKLDDGLPDSSAAFTWLTGTQNTGSVLRLRGDWVGAIAPRLVGISNTGLPVGTKVTAAFRRSSDAAGSYPYAPAPLNSDALQRVFAGVRGERTAWLMYQSLPSTIVGVEIQLWNDVNGAASIPAGFPFHGGEACVFAGDDLPIAKEWSDPWVDPTTSNYTPTKQPYTNVGSPYRQLDFKLPRTPQQQVYGDPALPSALDVERLFARMDRGQVCFYATRYRDASRAFSAHLLHRTGRLALATKLPKINHENGRWYTGDGGTIVEIPIPT